jgi:hypothetical protein
MNAPGRLIQLEWHKSFRMHSYKKCARKSFRTHSYKIIGLKVSWNQLLQKTGGWGVGPFLINSANQDSARSRLGLLLGTASAKLGRFP